MPLVHRGRLVSTGGGKFGASGTQFADMIFGSGSIIAPSTVTGNGFAASMAVSGVTASSKVFVIPGACAQLKLSLYTACAATDKITVSFVNQSGSDLSASNTIALGYFVFN